MNSGNPNCWKPPSPDSETQRPDFSARPTSKKYGLKRKKEKDRMTLEPSTFLIASNSMNGEDEGVEAFYAQMAAIRGPLRPREKIPKGIRNLKEQEEDKVRERLQKRGECQLQALQCRIGMCLRSFQSIRVLAWHMSYAHADANSSLRYQSFCFVCGQQLKTAKGKNSHLVTAHRDLCMLHNAECVQQRAPPSQMKRPRMAWQGRGEEDTDPGYLLDDELSFDEDSDFEEDVSVEAGTSAVGSFGCDGGGGDGRVIRARTRESPVGDGCVRRVETRVGSGIVARGLKHASLRPWRAEGGDSQEADSDPFVVVDDVDDPEEVEREREREKTDGVIVKKIELL